MSSAKKLSLLLLVLLLTLTAWLALRPVPTQTLIQGQLTDNTLTQSLDGQRRYFLIKLESSDTILMTVPYTAQCQIGEPVTMQLTEPTSQDRYYRFISCP